MADRSRLSHYIGLTIAVFIGVFAAGVAWFLFSTYVAGRVLEDATTEFVAETKEQVARQQARQKAGREARQRALERQRMNSQTGRDLGRRCHEFTTFLRDNPSGDGYALEQREEACRRYELYIETGRVYDKLPPRSQVGASGRSSASTGPESRYDQAMTRMETPTGKALRARCQELIHAYVKNPSDAARAEREAACRRFEHYLDTG